MKTRFRSWAMALAVVIVLGAVQGLDAHDFEADLTADQSAALAQLRAERRELMHRISVCHRAFGPQTQPGELEDGTFICVTARGEIADAPLEVAAK